MVGLRSKGLIKLKVKYGSWRFVRSKGYALLILLFFSCATNKLQIKDSQATTKSSYTEEKLEHRFYLVGDAGELTDGSQKVLSSLKNSLAGEEIPATVLFLGDNVYPNGYPSKKAKDREHAEKTLNNQLDAVKDFTGKTVFIPGNHDWYNGLNGLKRQEKHVEGVLGKNSFLPENGCPYEIVDIADNIVLIIVDSQWYLTDWDKHPTINDECEIKTRNKFFDEIEGEIKKAQEKTTIIAVHHPMYTNGPHGGQFSLVSNLTPIPILGSLKNIIRKTGGVINVDLQNSRYMQFKKRLVTIAKENERVVFVSGHEHNLQYLLENDIPQIISGSGSKINPTRNVGGGKFSFGTNGYAILDVYEDGSSKVKFYSATLNKFVYQTQVFEGPKEILVNYPKTFPNTVEASIYTLEETDKGKFYKVLWGDRYRQYYSTQVEAPVVSLDTLLGGLIPIRKGGGHQSKSLRLKDKNNREYVMRALRKQATQYLQTSFFTDQYIGGQFDNTYTEDLVDDVFTGSHPYAPFVIGVLSDAIGVYHTNPKLYYVPKQNALKQFNEDFGDELYMIEEHASEGHGRLASFGHSDDLVSTDDLLKKLRKDEDYTLDESAYIKARLFDMLIGDWDRHEDQWRWATFEENGKTLFRPVPRDRDQAFSIMGDGLLLQFATTVIPLAKVLRSYDEELKNPIWINAAAFPLDVALINQADKSVWDLQVRLIQLEITDQLIDEAFNLFPKEVNDQTIADIKRKLIGRRDNLQKIANKYYDHLCKYIVVKGTDKDDWFDIERLPQGKTKVTVYRIKGGKKEDLILERTYTHANTKELWVYGLDDDDVFKVFGKGNNAIKVKLVGGQNNDIYDLENGKKVTVYDFKSKPNTFKNKKGKSRLRDDYEVNVYDYKKLKNKTNQFLPAIGYNPDDGIRLGASSIITNFGFERNPFSSQHAFKAEYYFATNGYDLDYRGEIANVIGKVNLWVNVHFNSPNFSINYFGYGNETINPNAEDDETFSMDFNRVKIRTFRMGPSLIWKGEYGSMFKTSVSYQTNKVEQTPNRYISTVPQDSNIFENQKFLDANIIYEFQNQDYKSFPTLGMLFRFQLGYKTNLDNSNAYSYMIPELGFDYKLIPSGNLVLATWMRSQINFGDGFEFYQAATIGANNGLRGYRNERFTGNQSFVQSTDLRLNLNNLKNNILPLRYGIYAGFDYGRVWFDGEDSSKWNNSIGGGLFVEAIRTISGNLSLFNSQDGLRFAFKVGFGF